MGKALALASSIGGGGVVAVGGYYVISNAVGGKGEVKEKQTGVEKLNLDQKLEEFKKDKEGKCTKNFFSNQELDLTTLPTESVDLPTSDTSFFGAQTQDEAKNKSCLLINLDKKSYTSNGTTKWSGTFSWTWSFLNNDKGFITFNVASTSPHDKSLHLVGGFYLLSKETDNGQDKWKIKHYKEIKESNNKTIDSSNFANNFPKAKENSDVFKKENKDYWDFMKNASELSNICGQNECTETPTTSTPETKYKWSWKTQTGENTTKVGEWSNHWKWWEHLYGKTPFNLEDKLKDFSGKWEEANTSAT